MYKGGDAGVGYFNTIFTFPQPYPLSSLGIVFGDRLINNKNLRSLFAVRPVRHIIISHLVTDPGA
jgi:hypothetical protein